MSENFSTILIKRFFAWNINDDRRTTGFEGKAFPEFHSSRRLDGILNKIRKELAVERTLICLFEMTEQTTQRIISELSEFCTKTIPYNNSDGAFRFLFISTDPELLNVEAHPLTKSNVSFPNDHRPPAPKQGEPLTQDQIQYKEEILFDNFDKMCAGVHLAGLNIYVTHLGLTEKTRLAQTNKLCEIIKSREGHYLFLGDLNSFDSSSQTPTLFQAQIDPIVKLGCDWLTKDVKSTFNAFSFDIAFKLNEEEKKQYFKFKDEDNSLGFREFCLEMVDKYGTIGGPLDHAFASDDGLKAKLVMHSHDGLSDHDMIEVVLGV